MNEVTKGGSGFVGYEYKELSLQGDKALMYLDGYKNFGWVQDENLAPEKSGGRVIIRLKRDRKILNKAELTRLERHFEACMDEIATLEGAGTRAASAAAITIGVAGTVFMALSTFAVTSEPPLVALCIIFAVPGFIGWGLPYFAYKRIARRKTERLAPLTQQKYDEAYEVCEKGNRLLS